MLASDLKICLTCYVIVVTNVFFQNKAFADIQPGEMKYNKKVSEGIDVDISAIPEISPTLGVIAGRDRLSASNRSLTKRRPPSLRQNALLDSKEEGVRRVELSNGRAASGGRVSTELAMAI